MVVLVVQCCGRCWCWAVGGVGLWAVMCKHRMASAGTSTFPETTAGKQVSAQLQHASCCWNASWIPTRVNTKLLLLLARERPCGPRRSHPVLQMRVYCNSLLRAANGSPSTCGRVPSCRRTAVVVKHQATVCPTHRVHWRLDIFDHVPHSQPQVLAAVRCKVEGCQADLVVAGSLCGRRQSRRLRSCDVIVRSRSACRSGSTERDFGVRTSCARRFSCIFWAAARS